MIWAVCALGNGLAEEGGRLITYPLVDKYFIITHPSLVKGEAFDSHVPFCGPLIEIFFWCIGLMTFA